MDLFDYHLHASIADAGGEQVDQPATLAAEAEIDNADSRIGMVCAHEISSMAFTSVAPGIAPGDDACPELANPLPWPVPNSR